MSVDCHSHLNDEQFDNDLQEVVGRLSADNVDYAIVSGYDLKSSERAVEIADTSPILYATVGFHPENVDDIEDGDFEKLERMLSLEKVVGIGEIGLDYHWRDDNKQVQREIFIRQLEIAKRTKLPVVIHQRDCGMDVLDVLKEEGKGVTAVLHCYSESLEMAKEFLKLDCVFSFGGTLTYKNAQKTVEVAKYLPLDRILTETDCPYLSPVPFRGTRNEPKHTNLVLDKMAEIRGESREEILKSTISTLRRVFYKIK